MLGKNSVRLVALGAALLLALAALFYPTDEKRVKEAAQALVTAANRGGVELQGALERYAEPEVSVSIAELSEPLVGREAIVAKVADVTSLGQRPSFRLEAVEVSLEGKRARLNADLLTTLQAEVPELRRPRHSVALFEKRGDVFRLRSVEIGRPRMDQPEARP